MVHWNNTMATMAFVTASPAQDRVEDETCQVEKWKISGGYLLTLKVNLESSVNLNM